MMSMNTTRVANDEPARSHVTKAIGQSAKPKRKIRNVPNRLVSQLNPTLERTLEPPSKPTRVAAATGEIPRSFAYGTAKTKGMNRAVA